MTSNARPSAPEPSPMVALRIEAARRLGYSITGLDDETGYLHEVRRGTKRVVLLGAFSPLNDANAARIATDKFHTATILRARGFRVPDGVRSLQPGRFTKESFPGHTGLDAARRFAQQHGFPLVVKPNHGARGRDILIVEDDRSLASAVEQVWLRDFLALTQEPVAGYDIRLDFLDDGFLFGYTRQPVHLEGDGEQTLRQLLAASDPRFADPGFLEGLEEDPIWTRVTTEKGVTLDDVASAGTLLRFDTPILNLNRLCVGERLTAPPKRWVEHGLAVGRALGLRHFGIDFKAVDIDTDPTEATVIEVNASPSLAHMSRMGHYEATVEAEMKIVAAALG